MIINTCWVNLFEFYSIIFHEVKKRYSEINILIQSEKIPIFHDSFHHCNYYYYYYYYKNCYYYYYYYYYYDYCSFCLRNTRAWIYLKRDEWSSSPVLRKQFWAPNGDQTFTLAHHLSLGSLMVRASHRSSEGCGFDPCLGLRNRFSEYRAWRSFISLIIIIVNNIIIVIIILNTITFIIITVITTMMWWLLLLIQLLSLSIYQTVH